MRGLIEGRIVHYIPSGDDAQLPPYSSHHYAAIIAFVLTHESGHVGLCVFPYNEHGPQTRPAMYSNQRLPGTWHWPEKV